MTDASSHDRRIHDDVINCVSHSERFAAEMSKKSCLETFSSLEVVCNEFKTKMAFNYTTSTMKRHLENKHMYFDNESQSTDGYALIEWSTAFLDCAFDKTLLCRHVVYC